MKRTSRNQKGFPYPDGGEGDASGLLLALALLVVLLLVLAEVYP